MTPTYDPSPIKRRRRTGAEVETIRAAIVAFAREDHPTTNRHLFYQVAGLGLIEKTEAEYKRTICRLSVQMREAGRLPFPWITDGTRWVRRPRTYSSLENALYRTAETYRRALWDDQPVRVEIWAEKDAIAGILYAVTSVWDVPLYVVRGYGSVSYLHEAALEAREDGRPTYIYHFGDHDPSGLDIERHVREKLRQYAGAGVALHFERLAVTPEQIVADALPTRPTKRSDSRAARFEGASVDVDTLAPSALRGLAEAAILRHIDARTRYRLARVEAGEREALERIAAGIGGGR